MTKRIAYYITDHGYGHATRAVALIRNLVNSDSFDVLIRNNNALDLIRASLPNCRIFTGKTDMGHVLTKKTFDIDESETNALFSAWANSWDQLVKDEKDFMTKNKIDLVISDISCLPFLAAERAGIRSIGLSNFSWVDILSNFSQIDISLIRKLKRAYSKANFAIELFGSTGLDGFKKKIYGGLLCRRVSESRSSVRRMLGIGRNEIGVFITFGGSTTFDINVERRPAKFKIVVSNSLNYKGEATRVPANYFETQNIVGAMDIVISKGGYGIFSECIQRGIPLLIVPKMNNIEDRRLCESLEKHRLGRRCSLKSVLNGDILNEANNFLSNNVSSSEISVPDGNEICKDIIIDWFAKGN